MRSDFWLNNCFLHLIYFLPFHKTNLLISKNKVLSRKLILLIFNSSKSQQTFLVIFLPPKYFCFFLRKIFFFFQKKKSFTKNICRLAHWNTNQPTSTHGNIFSQNMLGHRRLKNERKLDAEFWNTAFIMWSIWCRVKMVT